MALSEAEGQAGSADDGGRGGRGGGRKETALHCMGEIPQTEEALHMNMDMTMRQMQDDKRLDGDGSWRPLWGERESEGSKLVSWANRDGNGGW